MAKPILVIRVDGVPDLPKWANDVKRHLNDEYHVFIISDPKHTGTSLEVLNAEKLDPTEIERLKEVINV